MTAWVDELAIRELAVRFSDAVTRGDWDQFEALFAPDAVWEESAPFAGKLVGARTIRETVAASLEAVDLYVQLPHGTVITRLGEERATATTTIEGVSGIDGQCYVNYGIYYDELVRSDAGWRFQHRWLQNVYAEPGSLSGHVGIARADLAALPQ